MSTVLPNQADPLEDTSSLQLVPKKVLKNTYASVLAALNASKKIILITADAQNGKTALLHTISKDIASSNRIISVCGKDLPSLDPSKTTVNNPELNSIKDFIIKSTDLKDKLIVILDDADYLPINFLSALISHVNTSATDHPSFQLLLTGPANFKDQLLTIDTLNDSDLTHCPINDLGDKEVLDYIKTKTYKISSNIKNLKFKPESLHALCEFSQTDKQILDVLLEWCAALTKKDQLSTITEDTINRAANFAQQFSKDKNLRLASSYPPSHEVYKYINDLQSNNKPVKNSTSSDSNKKKQTRETKTSTTTSKIETVIDKNKSPRTSNKSSTTTKENPSNQESKKVTVTEDEIMQLQWTAAAAKKTSADKKPLTALVGLLAILVLAFVFFITYRIGTDPVVDDSISRQIADNKTRELPVIEEVKTNVDTVSTNTHIENTVQKPKVAPLVLGDLDKSLLSEKSVSAETQKQKALKVKPDVEINKLLNLAEQQLLNKKLSTPVGDNAFETYKKILASQPNNKAALNGIAKVRDKYLNWANYYSKRNDFDRAKYFYRKALEINPNNSIALKSIQNIERQQLSGVKSKLKPLYKNDFQNNVSSKEIQTLLLAADEKMSQIIEGINTNKRNYKIYQEAHVAYQSILRQQPQNQQAKHGLSSLMNYYVDWAEQQIQSRNYNIALFLYGQALSIDPNNKQLSQRIEQVREIKNSL